jgi:hypothetical protein
MRHMSCFVAGLAAAGYLLASSTPLEAQTAVAIDADDIGGVVTGPHGPEAGVWVIAETRDLPTRYAKMVVTDDQGRYVVPDLPKANYQVWVRGYGLIDSPKADATPGKQVNLTAVAAPNDAAAAQYYPAIYWFSMGSPRSKINHASGAISLVNSPRGPSPRHWASSTAVRKRGYAAFSPVRPRRRWSILLPASSAACRLNISATGPIASSRANYISPSRRGRKASNAISW